MLVFKSNFLLKKRNYYILVFLFIFFISTGCKQNSILNDNPQSSVPNAPTNLSLTLMSSNQIRLIWNDNSSNENGFRIQRASEINGNIGTFEELGTVSANVISYDDSILNAENKYYYRIYSYNTIGNSDYSTIANITTTLVYLNAYYIDFLDGNDTNTGTSPQSAWKHAPGDVNATGNANRTSAPGDLYLFKGNVEYKNNITVNASGTSSYPIIFKGNSWGTEKAIIEGSEPLTGWTKCSSSADCGDNKNWEKIYYTTAPSGTTPLTSNLYQEDDMLFVSQQPNPEDPFFMDDLDSYFTVTYLTQTTAQDSWLSTIGGNSLIGSYVFAWRNGSEVDFRKISAYESSTNTITFASLGDSPYPQSSRWKIAISNNLNDTIFDREGEYYFDESTKKIYLWPINGTDPNDCKITISVKSPGFNIGNKNYITVEGFRIEKGIGALGNALTANSGCQGLVLKNCEIIKWRSQTVANVTSITSMGSALIENNYLSLNARLRGFDVTGNNIKIKYNTFIKIGRTPIGYMNGSNGEITDNYIYNCRGVHSNAISPYEGSNNLLVARNKVFKSNFSVTMQSCTNIQIINNIFVGDNYPSIALWTGAGINNITIKHNLLIGAGPGWTGFYSQVDNITGLVMKNNIIEGMTYSSGSGDISHNIYSVNTSPLGEGEFVITDLNSIFVNSANIDASNNNYHLKTASPAINKGTDINVTDDIDHNIRPYDNKPDIGPYEFKLN